MPESRRVTHKTSKAEFLFSTRGCAALLRFCGRETLMAFDLDGTLVPIVANFQRVELGLNTQHLLRALMKFYDVAVVSGRARANVRKIVAIPNMKIIGNHGLEKLATSQTRNVKAWRESIVSAIGAMPGVVVEDKGLSLSVHYRESPKKSLVRQRVKRVLRSLDPKPRVITGKLIYNLVPNVGRDKGTALLHLMKQTHSRRALFVGDDITDEDVFRIRSRKILSVKVGRSRRTKANYFLRSQDQVERLLRVILTRAPMAHEVQRVRSR